jgi:hypothetical protein
MTGVGIIGAVYGCAPRFFAKARIGMAGRRLTEFLPQLKRRSRAVAGRCGRGPQVDFSLLAHPAYQAPAPTRGPPPSRCRKVAAGAHRHTQRPKIRGRFRGQINWATRLPLDRSLAWASTVVSRRLLVLFHRGSKRRCARYAPLKFLPISNRLVSKPARRAWSASSCGVMALVASVFELTGQARPKAFVLKAARSRAARMRSGSRRDNARCRSERKTAPMRLACVL